MAGKWLWNGLYDLLIERLDSSLRWNDRHPYIELTLETYSFAVFWQTEYPCGFGGRMAIRPYTV